MYYFNNVIINGISFFPNVLCNLIMLTYRDHTYLAYYDFLSSTYSTLGLNTSLRGTDWLTASSMEEAAPEQVGAG